MVRRCGRAALARARCRCRRSARHTAPAQHVGVPGRARPSPPRPVGGPCAQGAALRGRLRAAALPRNQEPAARVRAEGPDAVAPLRAPKRRAQPASREAVTGGPGVVCAAAPARVRTVLTTLFRCPEEAQAARPRALLVQSHAYTAPQHRAVVLHDKGARAWGAAAHPETRWGGGAQMLVRFWRARWTVYFAHERARKEAERLVRGVCRRGLRRRGARANRACRADAQYFAAELIQRHYRAQLRRRFVAPRDGARGALHCAAQAEQSCRARGTVSSVRLGASCGGDGRGVSPGAGVARGRRVSRWRCPAALVFTAAPLRAVRGPCSVVACYCGGVRKFPGTICGVEPAGGTETVPGPDGGEGMTQRVSVVRYTVWCARNATTALCLGCRSDADERGAATSTAARSTTARESGSSSRRGRTSCPTGAQWTSRSR